jgi:hypothetical protein
VSVSSTCIWLSIGWVALLLAGVSTYFSCVITAFVGSPLVIALLSMYKFNAWSMGIIPAIAERVSSDTVL